jgi:hypothetical protein
MDRWQRRAIEHSVSRSPDNLDRIRCSAVAASESDRHVAEAGAGDGIERQPRATAT